LAPSLPWIWRAWFSSPLDAWGWVFLLLGCLWWFLVLDLLSAPSDAGAPLDSAGWPWLALGVGVAVLGLALDVRVALAAAALASGWAVAWLALLLLPALVLGLLALPTTGYLLQQGSAGCLGSPAGRRRRGRVCCS